MKSEYRRVIDSVLGKAVTSEKKVTMQSPQGDDAKSEVRAR